MAPSDRPTSRAQAAPTPPDQLAGRLLNPRFHLRGGSAGVFQIQHPRKWRRRQRQAKRFPIIAVQIRKRDESYAANQPANRDRPARQMPSAKRGRTGHVPKRHGFLAAGRHRHHTGRLIQVTSGPFVARLFEFRSPALTGRPVSKRRLALNVQYDRFPHGIPLATKARHTPKPAPNIPPAAGPDQKTIAKPRSNGVNSAHG